MSDHSERDGQDEPVIDLSTKLKQYERKRVQIKWKIHELDSEVKKRLPEYCQLVDDHADLVIVAWLQTSRVESNAKEAIKFAKIKEGDKDKTILVMFYQPSEAIKNDSYACEGVHHTFYEPINSLQPSDPPKVTPPNYAGQDETAIGLSAKLKEQERKRVQIKGNIPDLCYEVVKRLPESCQFVADNAELIVVVAMQESQVEIDAQKAIKSAKIKDGDKDKTILVIFYQHSNDKEHDSYTCKDVNQTFLEPINSLKSSNPPRVKPPNYAWSVTKVVLVIMVWLIGVCCGWYLRCYHAFPACVS